MNLLKRISTPLLALLLVFASSRWEAGVVAQRRDAKAKPRQMEELGRGVVAINQGNGRVFVGWRLLGTDPEAIAFNLYRTTDGSKPVKLNDKPVVEATSFVDSRAEPTKSVEYFVRPLVNGREQAASAPFKMPANPPRDSTCRFRSRLLRDTAQTTLRSATWTVTVNTRLSYIKREGDATIPRPD
jgi:rhamnogalacturonan endolyase